MPGGKRTDETGVCPPGKSSEKDRQYQAGDDPADDLLYGNSSERAEFRDGKGCQAGIRRGVLQRENRRIMIPGNLRKKLLLYIQKNGIEKGEVFITKAGNTMDRSNIWRKMKGLAKEAGVLADKIFPHNLRHLFARSFYEIDKDIAKLADVLGHSSINTTRIYMISTGEEHRRQLERLRLVV